MGNKNKKLSQLQQKFLKVLFTENSTLKETGVDINRFIRWLNQESFVCAIECAIKASYQQSSVMLAAYAPDAAEKLIKLTSSDKTETARKACLDIISLGLPDDKKTCSRHDKQQQEDESVTLSEQTAKHLLEVLAKESKKG